MPPAGEAAARRFYTDLIGIPEVPKPPELARRGGVWFETQTVRIHLGVEQSFTPARKAHPGLLVRDVNALSRRIADAGYEVLAGESLDGYDHVYVHDPFGNRLELLQEQPSVSPVLPLTPLETPRLILRPVKFTDAQQVQALFPHWEIVKYLDKIVPWPYPPGGVETFYRSVVMPGMERGKYWYWTLRLKTAPEEIIGAINLQTGNANRGFWLGLPWQGQGLMTEACDAVTDYWFDVLGFPVLRVAKAIANEASRRISEKQGMRVIGVEERDFVCGRLPAEICEITADEWRARRRGFA
jgi:RimJ/RimL family protein N-acetyltransferase